MANAPSSSSPLIRDVIAARISRREMLKGSLASGALIAGGSFVGSLFAGETHAAAALSTLGFPELKRVYDKTHAAAEGYEATIVARWGDPLAAGLPEFMFRIGDPLRRQVSSQITALREDGTYQKYYEKWFGSDD